MLAEFFAAAALAGPPKTIQNASTMPQPTAVVEVGPAPATVTPPTDAAEPAHQPAAADTAAAPSESATPSADPEGCIPQPFPATGCYEPSIPSYEADTYVPAPGTEGGTVIIDRDSVLVVITDDEGLVEVLPIAESPLSYGPPDPDAFMLSEGGLEVAG